MVRKSVGYVELEWTCPRCGNENPGPRKFCNGCGGPQPEDVEFHQAAQRKLLTDNDQIKQAKAGPDVHCPYCHARNPDGVGFCGACGGDLNQAQVRASGQVLGAFKPDPEREIACTACGTLNLSSARECAGCGISLAETRQPTPAAPRTTSPMPTTTGRKLPGWIVILGGIACVASAIFIFSLLTRTDELIGTVTGFNWRREQTIEVLGPVRQEGWIDQIPAGAELGGCSQTLRETSDRPAANSVEVCGTPYTVDQGTGYGEVVQDCVYEVYDDWCTYTESAWTVFDTLTITGTDLNLSWPETALQEGQRLGDRSAEYNVTFESNGEKYNYETTDEVIFRTFEIGSKWLLTVNSFGAIVSLEPAQ